MPSPSSALTAAALLATGGVGGAAIAARPDGEPVRSAPAARRAAPVEVRTVVVHRTVRVVHHVRPRRRPAPAPAVTAAPVAVAPPTAAPAPAPAVAVRARPVTVRRSAPLTTRSSATGGGGGGGEHEGGGDD